MAGVVLAAALAPAVVLLVPPAGAIQHPAGTAPPPAGSAQPLARAARPSAGLHPLRKARASAGPSSSVPSTPLQRAWQSVAAEPSLAHAIVAGYAYDLTTGKPLADLHSSWRLTPGSVMKLFTSSAALSELGPQFRYQTKVEVGPAAGGGRDVYLVGGGDPLLEAGHALDLEGMARKVLSHLGTVKRVVGVSTLYGGPEDGTGWDYSDLGPAYTPNVAALTSEHDDVQVTVRPGAAAGDAAAVALDTENPPTRVVPPDSFIHVVNRAVTAAAGTKERLSVTEPVGTNVIKVTGRVPLGSAARSSFFWIVHPALLTATLFQRVLAGDGVHFTEPPATGSLPAGARLLDTHLSAPLRSYLIEQNQWSINLMAEQLWHMLGAARSGVGTPATSAAAMRAFILRAGLSPDYVQVDGSGLSGLDEVSPAQVVALLRYDATQPWFQTLKASLIHAGVPGKCSFMCPFLNTPPAKGHVWFKTGNLANQWNYAGYARAENGDLVAFTLFFDGLPASNSLGEAIGPIDRMTQDVAAWPHEPRGTSAAPATSSQPTGTLPPAVHRLIGPLPAGSTLAGEVVNVRTGKVTWADNAGISFQGGMLPRLVTVAAALDNGFLPSGAAVETTGHRNGSTLEGPLVLEGRNDPTLDGAQLRDLARRVAAEGLTRIPDGLSYTTTPVARLGGPWAYSLAWEELGQWWAPPATSLSVDGDVVSAVVHGGPRPGARPSVRLQPGGIPVTVIDDAHTAAAGAPLQATWVLGTLAYRLTGSVAPGARVVLHLAPTDPGAVAAAVFTRDLAAVGVHVAGPPRAVRAAPRAKVLAHVAPPSAATLANLGMRDPSDLVAYDLYGLMGPAAPALMTALVGPVDQIVDPSGIAAYDYLTAGSMAQFLAAAWSNPPDRHLTRALLRPWVVQEHEDRTVAGFLRTPGGQLDAYVLIQNALPWSPGKDPAAALEPRILSP